MAHHAVGVECLCELGTAPQATNLSLPLSTTGYCTMATHPQSSASISSSSNGRGATRAFLTAGPRAHTVSPAAGLRGANRGDLLSREQRLKVGGLGSSPSEPLLRIDPPRHERERRMRSNANKVDELSWLRGGGGGGLPLAPSAHGAAASSDTGTAGKSCVAGGKTWRADATDIPKVASPHHSFRVRDDVFTDETRAVSRRRGAPSLTGAAEPRPRPSAKPRRGRLRRRKIGAAVARVVGREHGRLGTCAGCARHPQSRSAAASTRSSASSPTRRRALPTREVRPQLPREGQLPRPQPL